MKTAAKVFIIISMVVLPISFLTTFLVGINAITAGYQVGADEDLVLVANILIGVLIAIGVLLITSEVIGGLALHKLKVAKSKNELTVISVFTLLFCTLIGGILMLCIPEEEISGSAPVTK
jgi:hypothetical protein